jgi:endo-1,4-beta-D-glucanase Y
MHQLRPHRSFNLALFASALVLGSVGACSSDGGGDGGNTGGASAVGGAASKAGAPGTGGSTTPGGGTSAKGGSGGMAGTAPSGGAPPGTTGGTNPGGGNPPVGGGASGAPPVGNGGTPPTGGSGGGVPTGGMPPVITPPAGRTCPVTEGLVADFEENSAMVLEVEGRLGKFEGYGDAAGTMTAEVAIEGTEKCNQGVFHIKGSNFAEYVGVAAVMKGTFDATEMEYVPSGPYDASAFNAVSFRAKKGAGQANPVRFGIATPWTEGEPHGAGTCDDTDETKGNKCWNHLGHFLIDDEALTDQWKTYTFCFDRDFYPLFLPNGVTTEQRRQIAANILKLQFQFNQSFDATTAMELPKTGAFDFFLDDVRFVKGAACDGTIFASTDGATDAFGTNGNLGTCAPATDAAKYNRAISEAYARWKVTFVNAAGAVFSPEQNGKIISEGIGYGMLIAAAMGDKPTFDKIWGWAKPKLANGLLGWDNGSGGSATDADTDIAYALLMGAKQWGGTYAADGNAMAGAAKARDLDGDILKAGDSWGGDTRYNPSYFSPGFYGAFGAAWSGVSAANYGVLDACDTQFSGASDGLVPDWCQRSGAPMAPSGAQVTSGTLCPMGQACYTYDAARTPWRIGYDVCTGGTAGSAYITRLLAKFNAAYENGARIDLMKAGWGSTGAALEAAVDNEMAFIGPMGVAAMASASGTAMRDRAFRTVLDIIERPEYYKTYYSTTLGILSLLMLSGNWPAP